MSNYEGTIMFENCPQFKKCSQIDKTFGITDIGTWWNDVAKGKIFRYQIYKRMFTPHEQEEKYVDEDIFEDNYHFGFISNIMEIPNDILLEIDQGYFDVNKFQLTGNKVYVKLSEIRLYQCESDNKDVKVVEYEEIDFNTLYEN